MPEIRQRKTRRRAAPVPTGGVRPFVFPAWSGRRDGLKAGLRALALAVVFHLLLLVAMPARFGEPAPAAEIAKVVVENREEIPPDEIPEELLPPELRKPKPRFVEVNPVAPAREPDPTINEGAGSQRAAQPVPDAQPSDLPKNDGEEANAIRVANNIPRELVPAFMRPEAHRPLGTPDAISDSGALLPGKKQPAAEGESAGAGKIAKADGVPLSPHGEKFSDKKDGEGQGDSPEKKGQSAEKSGDGKPEIRIAETRADDSKTGKRGVPDGVPNPKPRPQAVRTGTTGITMKKAVGTNEAGVLAVSAKYSEFGDYTQRMIETIQAQWWITVERSRIREDYNSKVVIEFTLRRDGVVCDAVVVSTSASASGTYACLDAIESRSPFDPWREDMVAAIGEEERGRFTFYYR